MMLLSYFKVYFIKKSCYAITAIKVIYKLYKSYITHSKMYLSQQLIRIIK